MLLKAKKFLGLISFLIILISFLSPAELISQNKTKEIEKVEKAIDVLKELVELPEEGIPEALLHKAEATAMIPGFWKADIILVFKNRRSVSNLAEGKFTLGADAGLAAGPIGRKAEASTDIAFEAEIYSYSKSKGLFAGVSIEGAVLSIDRGANAQFYRDFDLTAEEILAKTEIRAPQITTKLREIVARYSQ